MPVIKHIKNKLCIKIDNTNGKLTIMINIIILKINFFIYKYTNI